MNGLSCNVIFVLECTHIWRKGIEGIKDDLRGLGNRMGDKKRVVKLREARLEADMTDERVALVMDMTKMKGFILILR